MINRGRFCLFAQTREYPARAIALVERSLVIDMLCPMTLNFPLQAKWNKDPESFTAARARSGLEITQLGCVALRVVLSQNLST